MIPTRILIVSDTHGRLPSRADHGADIQVPFHDPLPSADVLIHCGDLTMNGRVEDHQAALQLIKSINAPVKIVIPGNHDITLDRKYYAQYPKEHAVGAPYPPSVLDDIYRMYTGPEALAAGITYLVEGAANLTLENGARLNVYASAYQPEFFNWAFGYPRTEDRYNPHHQTAAGISGPENPVPDHGEVDVMITHGPPKGILDLNWRPHLDRPSENCGCEHLRRAVQRCKPRVHCFGHIHEAWGAVRKKWDVDLDDDCAKGSRSLDTTAQRDPSTEKSATANRQAAAPQTTTTTPTPGRKPLGPYNTLANPNAYYMYADQASTNQSNPGETLIMPDDYQETQVPQMCATVDARDLEFGKETLFVNACVVNLRYQARNAPWLVDVLLPEAGAGHGGREGGEKGEGKERGGQ